MSKAFIVSKKDEFFELESFSSRGDFLAEVHTYQFYFNLARPNSHKENLTPWQIIERLTPRSPLDLCFLPPAFLDYYLKDEGGYDVPRPPYRACPCWESIPGRSQKWVSVPVIFVRRTAHEKIAKETGRRITANNSKPAIDGSNSRVEAWPKIAARIPSRE